MLDDLVGVIETLRERISSHGISLQQNETRTRTALIDPLLKVLGWDVSDPRLVTPEYPLGGGRVDYALMNTSAVIPAATVEAKKLGEQLDSHRLQMLNYANADGIRYAGLTDGNHWEMYEIFKAGSLEERRRLNLSIVGTPTYKAALEFLLLWRPNLASGQPAEASASVFSQVSSLTSQQSDVDVSAEHLIVSKSEAVVQNSATWTPIHKVEVKIGQGKNPAPKEIRFNQGQPKSTHNWAEMHIEVVDWLARNGSINSNQLPIKSLGFINSVAKGPNGGLFGVSHQVSGGIFVNIKMSARSCVKNSVKLLSYFGVDPKSVEVRFE